MSYYKTEEGKVNLIILLIGIIGIFVACISRNRMGDTFFTIMLSVSTSVASSAIVAFIMAAYLYRRNEKTELIEKWGISSITSSRGIINSEVNTLFETNVSHLDIIAYGLKSFREARGDTIKRLLENGMKVRIITVRPGSGLLNNKDLDENKVLGSTEASINKLVEWCDYMRNATKGNIELRYIDTLPTEVYFCVDNNVFVGPYQIGRESQQTITMRFTGNTDGVEYYKQYFENLWMQANTPIATTTESVKKDASC